ncbi:MAG: repeat, subgroup [Phycisphaerales bacterium]|nr:repeat, subgroup [Phycisphaerales bacterium]
MMKTAIRILALLLTAFPAAQAEADEDAAKARQYPRLLARLEGSGGGSVSFSPDGGMILTAGYNEARVWGARTFAPLTKPLDHGAPIIKACLAADGKTAFTIGGKEARVWDVRTSKLRTDPIQLIGPVRHADVSRDDSRVATCERVDEHPRGRPPATAWIISVWDANTGKRLLSLSREDLVTLIAFSPDGTRLLVVELELTSTFHLFDIRSGHELFKPIETGYAFMPTGSELVPASFSPDGSKLVIADVEGFQIREAQTGKLLVEGGGVDGWKEKVHAVGFNSDGRKVVTVTNDGNAHLWAAEAGFAVGHSVDPIYGWSLSPTDSVVVAYPPGWLGQSSGLFDFTTGKKLQDFGKDAVRGVAFSPDGTLVAFGGPTYTAVWKIKSGKVM